MNPKYTQGIRVSLFCLKLFFVCLFSVQNLKAQDAQGTQPILKDVKVVSETTDAKGNTVRTIQFSQGAMKVTETIVLPPVRKVGFKVAVRPDTLNTDSLLVLVKKSQYTVEVYYRKKIIRSYRAVFGPRPLENKCMEGDRCTPEGWFKITSKNPNSQYHKFMLLSYPNDSAIARFNQLKAMGRIPKTASIGGSVGIHGIWQGGDDMIDMGIGWTDGCVALRNTDVDELFTLIRVGTKVFIKK